MIGGESINDQCYGYCRYLAKCSLYRYCSNDALAKETTTDANGLINDTISGLKVGTNVLQIKALSVTNEQVGSSEKLVFTYQGQSDNLLKSFTATPKSKI